MKTTVFMKPGQVAVKEVDMPKIMEKDDVILRVVRTCVCGSDLWNYRGDDAKEEGSMNSGHEVIGIVEEAGEDITTFKKGDFVIAPFIHSFMAVDIVRLVKLDLKGIVKVIQWGKISLVATKQNMFVINMRIGH